MAHRSTNLNAYIHIIATLVVLSLPLAAQSGPTPQPAPAVVHPPSSPSLDERVIRLEERVNLANERSENAYQLLQYVGVIAAVALVFFSLRDLYIRGKEERRQRGIDEIVMETMKLQKDSVAQQVRFGQIHLDQVEPSQHQQFETIDNVNKVIDVVKQTLAFRLEQEEKVAQALKEIERIKMERDRTNNQKLAQAQAILDHFLKMSRMEFATLTDEQYKRGLRLEGLVNDLGHFLGDQSFEVSGNLFYTCGVIAYYDNDIIEAKNFLDRAAQCRASDHEGELATNENYRNRFAFIHYFRTLIHKNWGDLAEAQHEIEQSFKLLGDGVGEFLTPVTKAEIRSYIVGDEERCRAELQDLLQRLDRLEAELKDSGGNLNSNQKKLRNRMLLLLGNAHFVQKDFKDALDKYSAAIEFNPNDYYALASAAQCERFLGEEELAAKHFRRSLEGIERSGDIRRKRERITRAVIAVIAANAAKRCGDRNRQEQYTREARDLLSGNLAVDGMSPRFFSPSTKRLVSAAELLKDLEL